MHIPTCYKLVELDGIISVLYLYKVNQYSELGEDISHASQRRITVQLLWLLN